MRGQHCYISLRKRTDIVIKPADKGSAMVIMSRKDHEAKVMDYLNNGNFYRKLQEDLTKQFLEEITTSLTDLLNRQVIDREVWDFLRPKQVRTARFYILPKIHKTNIPGRPIVSSCGAATENISFFSGPPSSSTS